ncbi:MAG: DUF1957 domain-containing protein [Candidatus Riflebacteria bacterium]|nr:DUF1957 domain-containing protein [Candidatus Riflebacteria bacterium]
MKGSFALVLHAHLPFVRHPEHDEFLEEDWLFEAITETYIPLLEVFEKLLEDGVRLRVSMSVTPTLASMLADPLLQSRYRRRIGCLIELAEREVQRTRWLPDFQETARHYLDRFRRCREVFEDRCHGNLLGALSELARQGGLELLTCAATHGFLPLLSVNPAAVRAQIWMGARCHRRLLGLEPRGIWLPECGYTPGLETQLAREGIRFFLVDAHGVLSATPAPKLGVFEPVRCGGSVAAFGRDLESSRSVWSANVGYPGDPEYRDFYRDIGYDLDYDYVQPYIRRADRRIPIGIKYHRITGPTDAKLPYRPEAARERAAVHAGDFVGKRVAQVERVFAQTGRRPIVVSPYDAELFGHWWYEGPQFVDFMLRKLHFDQQVLRATTPVEYLDEHPNLQEVRLPFSSWGHHGYGEVWLNESNDWIYPHLHKAADRMVQMADRFLHASGLPERALNQMARELMLAQSSDWAFIMSHRTAVEYATRRTRDHLGRFAQLHDQLDRDASVDERFLAEVESRDNIFPDLDFRIYSTRVPVLGV